MAHFWLVLDYLESPHDCFEDCWIFPDVAWVIVASNEDSSWSKRNCGPFNLSFKWVVVCPDLKVVSKHVMFLLDVLNKYCLFALVTIPPFVGHLYVSVWVAFSAVSGLA